MEHSITELYYGINLVELMLKQAPTIVSGKNSLNVSVLENYLIPGSIYRSIEELPSLQITIRLLPITPTLAHDDDKLMAFLR